MGGSGYYSSLAFDSAGLPTIAFTDWNTTDLKLARFTGSTWTTEVVAGAGIPSLGFEGTGHPAIAYQLTSVPSSIGYTWWDGGSWQSQIVFAGNGRRPSLVFQAGEPRIAFVDTGGTLHYAHREFGGWTIETVVSANAEGNSSLTVDGFGNPNIVYAEPDAIRLLY